MKRLAVLFSLLLPVVVAPSTTAAATHGWSGAWAAAPQRPFAGAFAPNWSESGFRDQSLRQVVRISAGGRLLRLRLSNLYGTAPLRLTGVTVAKTRSGASIRSGTIRRCGSPGR
ncbi:hypothetical protein [Nonomuraea mesophila]|uniref:hypothetical protein n=1 Tax=Nonomuraea mesophila TaxID=2530382 RepID=UPI001C705E93|nr:hypothetical protein [Nonomuraea mesophila]